MIRISQEFKKGIEALDFQFEETGASLLFVSELFSLPLSPKEIFALETAAGYKADAVYFRKFEDNRGAIPQIYIYDNTKGQLEEEAIAEIHKDLWSSCTIPIFIIIEKSRVRIFDSRSPVQLRGDELVSTPIEIINITSDAVRQYSAKLFDNGSFWELNQNSNRFLASTSAYQELITGLKKIRIEFIKKSELPEKTAHKLLVLSILIKYLEERGEEGESIFSKNFFKQFGAQDFCGVLRNRGKILFLFEKLAEKFNGKIFEWSDPAERAALSKCDLSMLASFLDGNNRNNQYVIWKLYSFTHLPIELISSVYEEFLGENKKDVVYTPDFLVNFLVDEVMPIDVPKNNFKLIDASCGSGIFLVIAFKRLVEWWRFKRYKETNTLERPNLKQLKEILRESIHGVDIEEDATRLTTFSLCLALCDMLTPKQIWTDLRFDDLSKENIVTSDFFKFLSRPVLSQFDLVIGNPPFEEYNEDRFNQTVKENSLPIACKIPQNQSALLFLDQAMRLLKEQGTLCLILPSAPLLYNNTLEFRKYFLSKYNVPQVIDFTNLSSVLFGKSNGKSKVNVATAALFAENRKPDTKDILHVTIRRTKAVKERIFFEIDHYDFHYVSKDSAMHDPFVWKSNLLGGGRLNVLIDRLSKLRTIGELIENKVKTSSWVAGEGFIRGNENDPKAEHITGKKSILGKNFTNEGYKLEVVHDVHFDRPRTKELFSPPLLLIKEIIEKKNIPTAFVDYYAPFDSRIVGVHAPKKDADQLLKLHNDIKASIETYVFYILATSSQSFVNFATAVQKKDIFNLPYPEDTGELKLSYAEKILRNDVLDFTLELLSKGENAAVNRIAKESELKKFSDVYCKALNSIYQEGNKQFVLQEIIDARSFYGCVFSFCDKPDTEHRILATEKAEQALKVLVENNAGKNLRVIRVLKFYKKDKVYLIKPKQLRYWLKSMALKDADETFKDLITAGY